MSEGVKHVYQAIAEVTRSLSTEGIRKGRTAQAGGQGSYSFRGVDDVYNALAARLATSGLCILPRVLERIVTERTNKNGTLVSYVVLTVEFDLVSAVDGSSHTVRTMGEAMDTSDKATNKAMSAAYKYCCFLVFCIPTEGDNDSENAHHETAARAPAPPASAPLPKNVRPSSESAQRVQGFLSRVERSLNIEDLAKVSADVHSAVMSGAISKGEREILLNAYKLAVMRLETAA